MAFEDRYVTATPEGVSLDIVLAGLGSRFIAFALDFVCQVVVYLVILLAVVHLVLPHPSTTGLLVVDGVDSLLALLTFIGYFVACELLFGGRTLGKRAAGLRVVRVGGQQIGFWSSLLRNVLRVVDSLPGIYLVGSILILATKRNQRLGDLVAGTIVIRERTAGAVVARHAEWGDVARWGAAAPQAPGAAGAAGAAGATGAPGAAGGAGAAGAAGAVGAAGAGVAAGAVGAAGAGVAAGFAGAGGGASLGMPWLPPELAHWDVSAVPPQDLMLARTFLANRQGYDLVARQRLAVDLANRIWPYVSGPTVPPNPEAFLDAVLMVKAARG